MILPEDKTRLLELIKKTRHLWKFLDCDEKKKSILELEETMSSPTFWNNQKEAKRVSSEANRLKQTVEKIESFRVQVEDLNALAELCDEDENDQEMESEFIHTLEELLGKVEELEVASFLGEPFDDRPALLSIHAGAGGTDEEHRLRGGDRRRREEGPDLVARGTLGARVPESGRVRARRGITTDFHAGSDTPPGA
mgnify:CR=1 FL=1